MTKDKTHMYNTSLKRELLMITTVCILVFSGILYATDISTPAPDQTQNEVHKIYIATCESAGGLAVIKVSDVEGMIIAHCVKIPVCKDDKHDD